MSLINLNKIQSYLRSHCPDCYALLISSHVNRLFSSGFSSSAGVHLVTKTESIFITDFRYIEAAGKQLQNTELIMIRRGEKYPELLNKICQEKNITTLAYEDKYMTVSELNDYQKAVKQELVPQGALLNHLRASKNEEELGYMRHAQDIADKAFSEILGEIKSGLTERQLQAKLIYALYASGADALSFDPIVVSGANSSLPHGCSTDKLIQPGDFITMDFGALYKGYCSDMTRTVCVGTPTDEMKNVYQIVLEAQLLGIRTARAGLHMKNEYDKTVRDFITSKGYGPEFGHGLGHGVGIEIHESTDFDSNKPDILPSGCVISCEPGIYLPEKFGVRIEDCLILRESCNENITHSPKELICL